MTRKDYILLAAALRRARVAVASAYPVACTDEERARDAHRAAVLCAVEFELAEALASDNPRFERAKFLAAVRGGA